MQRKTYLMLFSLLFVFLVVAQDPSSAKIVYVDDDAAGANNGTNWIDAYLYLQDALSEANDSQKPVEIHVAKGIYTPDRGIRFTTGDKFAMFSLKNGVTILGGFAGFAEPDPNERNIEKYKTTLSGDLEGNDIEVEDPCDLRQFPPTRSDNSYTVLTSRNTDQTAILDGLTITAGYNTAVVRNGPAGGAGMFNESSSPTLIDCTFTANAIVSGVGAGLFNRKGSNPTLVNCTFTGNYAASGAGMCNLESDPNLTNCVFYNNSSGMYNRNSKPALIGCIFKSNFGIGVYNHTNSKPKLLNCMFINNLSDSGAGIYNDNSSPTLIGCFFIGNIAQLYGGGMFNGESSYPSLFYCIFSGNSSERGGGIFNLQRNGGLSISNCTFSGNSARFGGSGVYSYSEMAVINCIFWSNLNPAIIDEAAVTITYSDIQGGWPGEGNIDTDPCFVDSGYWDPNGTPDEQVDDFWVDGNYHLKSQAGRWEPTTQAWTMDDVTSPCIDAGNPNSSLGHEPFPNGGRVNMGAYGGTAEASKSYFGKPTCETIVAGDINGDCKVDFLDFAILAYHWLEDNNP